MSKSRYLYLMEGLTVRLLGLGCDGFRDGSMFKSKPKAYRVVLDGEIGGHSMMLVLGCSDLDECIRYTNKTKDKGQKIFDIQEIKR